MSIKKINIQDLSDEISKMLTEYVDNVEEIVEEETDNLIKEAKLDLVSKSPKDKGDYARSWTITQKKYKGLHVYSRVIHNKDHYRLTHLLEFGPHAKDGSWVPAQPHIRSTEQKYKQQLSSNIERRIKR